MKINIKDLKKTPSDILLPVALFALCAGSVWLAVSSTKESLKVNLPAPHKRTGLEFEEGAAYSR